MAWCPKCKNEYREGITVCAECGCELVDYDPSESRIPLIFGEEEQMGLLAEFLRANKIQGVEIRFDDQEQVYELLVKEEDRQKASKYAKVFLEQEALRRAEEAEENEIAAEEKAETPAIAMPYHSSEEAAEDNRSSAWTLLVVGVIGLVVMILGVLEILPFGVGNPYMFYGVMSAIFILFIVMGVVSMKNAKLFEKKAESENSLKDALLEWCKGNLDGDAIDAEIIEGEELTPEILYFRRFESIKQRMNHQFLNLDQAFLDRFIDEVIYDMVFPQEG